MNRCRSAMNLSESSRRDFLRQAGGGAGLLALAALMAEEDLLAADSASSSAADPRLNPLAPKRSHFPAKAKSVIWLFMNGGPSHVDTWQYKPELEKYDGQEMKGLDPETGFFKNAVGPLMKSPFKFTPRGKCGKMVSSLFPQLGEHVDKM